jgi:cation:H+ antiporter
MLLQYVLLILGLVILYFGAEAMVKGASQLAMMLGISPLVVGLTVVAFGTSAPEFLVSLLATLDDSEGISVGNIIGSNICNLALILGTASIISPLAISASALKREYPIMLLSSLLFFGFAYTGSYLEQWEGLILFLGIILFVGYNLGETFRSRRKSAKAPVEPSADDVPELDEGANSKTATIRNVALVIFGLVGLAGGAHLMVVSASTIARHFEISDFIIGTTIVAFGTSLPELATSVVAALRKESDISVGNIFGSNIFNVMFIMGSVPMVFGMEVEARALVVDFPLMIGMTLLTFPMMRAGYRISRAEGAFLVMVYLGYVLSLFLWPLV